MKLIFISATFSIIWYMRKHRGVSQTYSKEEDTFKISYLVGPAFVLALLVNHELSVMEARVRAVRACSPQPRLTRGRAQVLWTFSIYLEAVAILPQLVRCACEDAFKHNTQWRVARPRLRADGPRRMAGDAAKLGQRGQPDGALRLLPRVRARWFAKRQHCAGLAALRMFARVARARCDACPFACGCACAAPTARCTC
jgi:hypothetical protein